MAKEQFDHERIEWIPPSWAEPEGTEDTVIAYSVLPKESIYIIMRQKPPREVTVPPKYEYKDSPYGFGRRTRVAKGEYRTGTRRMAPEWFREIRTRDGGQTKTKNRLVIEEAYIEWLDADNKVPFEYAFADHPELRALNRDNPRRNPQMKGLTNDEVADRFYRGDRGESYAMTSYGNTLFSYGTIIMQRVNGKVIANMTDYSRTTLGHQAAARRANLINYVVYGVPMYTKDLVPFLMKGNIQLAATSKVGGENVDITMMKRHYGDNVFARYFREIYSGDELLSSEELDLYHAYLEYRDADRRLIPVHEVFVGELKKVTRLQQRYGSPGIVTGNPSLGKRVWNTPWYKWHQEGTQLIAESKLRWDKNQHQELVSLYRTAKNNYFLEHIIIETDDRPKWGWLERISEYRAKLEYRDAERKLSKYEDAFPHKIEK